MRFITRARSLDFAALLGGANADAPAPDWKAGEQALVQTNRQR